MNLTKIFNGNTKKESTISYDNPRENIDPHIKTKVVSSKELWADNFYKNKTPLCDASPLMANFYGGFEGTNPVLTNGTAGQWDDGGIREISNVLYDPQDTAMPYKLWYSGYTGAYTDDNTYIGLAYSSDGKTWTKYAGNPLISDRSLEDPYIVKHKGVYYMIAEDKGDSPFHNMRMYHSSDGITWAYDNEVLDKGAGGAWDNQDVSSPTWFIDGNTWYLFYEGRKTAGQQGAVGLATSTDNGVTWTKSASNPVCGGTDSTTATFAWATHCVPDDIIKIGEHYLLFVHAYDGAFRIAIAQSLNLTIWGDYWGTYVQFSEGYDYGDSRITYNGKEWLMYHNEGNNLYCEYPQIQANFNARAKKIITTGELSGGAVFGKTIQACNGFTGAGAYTNFTISGGIIIAAS